ncbi:Uncharacterized protein HZ326_21949 [Fusarium oxysporum f. sp. albedinis]|nr:Uncharacterized protein HZ326_21949 [Fusarium oxysporum f. sp. albedinis]
MKSMLRARNMLCEAGSASFPCMILGALHSSVYSPSFESKAHFSPIHHPLSTALLMSEHPRGLHGSILKPQGVACVNSMSRVA